MTTIPQMSHIQDDFLFVAAGPNTFFTANTTAGGDTVLALLDANYQFLAADDDSNGFPNSRLTFNVPASGFYHVIIYAYSAPAAGTTELWFNGVNMGLRGFGGSTLCPLLPTGNWRVATAMPPNGVEDGVIFVRNGISLTAHDDDSGVGLQAQLDVTNAPLGCVLVGAFEEIIGAEKVYVNDARNSGADQDGDGLGQDLEALLGTCDRPTQPGCAGVPVRRDTDRDGISDFVEVFGKDDPTFPQYMQAWGANPRHKDIFVEVDVQSPQVTTSFTPASAHAVADYFNAGPAADVLNPDGAPGIAIHLDLGITPTDPSDYTLFGDWGGFNSTMQTSWETSRDVDRAPVRRNLFHHALATAVPDTSCCGGQGNQPGDGFGFTFVPGGALNYWGFAHELGHNVNLDHFGHPSWGRLNCKPHYQSMMNYPYQKTFGFSLGSITSVLDSSNVSENNPLPGVNLDFLAPLFDVSPPSVDWNRDGGFAANNIRAAVAWSNAGCEARVVNRQFFWNHGAGQNAMATPRLAMFSNSQFLYLFWIDVFGKQVSYAKANVSSSAADGSCPLGGQLGSGCVTWEAPQRISVADGAEELDVAYSDDQTARLFIRKDSGIYAFRADVQSDGTLSGWSQPSSNLAPGGATAGPAVANISGKLFFSPIDMLAVFFTERVNGVSTHRYRSTPYTAQFNFGSTSNVQDQSGHVAQGSITPGVTSFAIPGCGSSCAFRSTCGAFPDASGVVQLWCHTLATGWRDISADAFTVPGFTTAERTTVDPPTLAVHVTRAATGGPATGGFNIGQLYMVTAQPPPMSASRHSPIFWATYMLDSNVGPFATPVRFQRQQLAGVGMSSAAGTGVAMLETTRLHAMKATYQNTDPSQFPGVVFVPLFDGTVRESLKDGSDFQVMERGACIGLSPAAGCGPANQFGY